MQWQVRDKYWPQFIDNLGTAGRNWAYLAGGDIFPNMFKKCLPPMNAPLLCLVEPAFGGNCTDEHQSGSVS